MKKLNPLMIFAAFVYGSLLLFGAVYTIVIFAGEPLMHAIVSGLAIIILLKVGRSWKLLKRS